MDARNVFSLLRFGAKFDSKELRKPRFNKSETKTAAAADVPIISDDDDDELFDKENNGNNNTKTNDFRKDADELKDDENDEIDFDQQQQQQQPPIRLTKEIVAAKISDDVTSKSGRKKMKNKQQQQTEAKTDEKRREALSQFRKQKRIYVWGGDVPDPCPTFPSIIQRFPTIPQQLTDTMRNCLSSWTPTPIQMQAIPIMMQGRELLASAPTGSGKTLAFLIPLLAKLGAEKSRKGGFRAVIIEPTRELAKQVYREILRMNDKLGLRVHMITNLEVAKEKFGPESKRRLDILISTPNRLVHLLNGDTPALDLSKVEWLIVDESDKLFETGTRGFRDQLAVIHQACDESRCRRAFFSATFSYDVEQWCKAYLDNVLIVSIGARNTAASTVEQELTFVGDEYGKLVALRNLITRGLLPPILIFVQTKERAESLYSEMRLQKLKVGVIHSDRDRKERDKIVKRFRSGQLWFLICTELMGRGIDFKNVNVVINYDFPPSAISYIHRIGRTGRAGRRGKAITFFTEYDRPLLRSVANVMREAGCPTPDYMLHLKKPRKRQQEKLTKRCAQRPNVTILRGGGEKNRKRRANVNAAANGRKKRKLDIAVKESE